MSPSRPSSDSTSAVALEVPPDVEGDAVERPTAPGVPRRRPSVGFGLGLGMATLYLSLIVLIPLAAVVWHAFGDGWSGFWTAVRSPQAWSALMLTIALSVVVALVNLVMGTLLAWVLVRDSFPGRQVVEMLIDLPFVVRTVQPVLIELDPQVEEAAHSLGASRLTTFRRVLLPSLLPAMLAGTALAFTRSMSEFGSTVLISGNLPFQTEVAAVHVYGQIESDNVAGAAAVSTVLLFVALVVLVALDVLQRWGSRRG